MDNTQVEKPTIEEQIDETLADDLETLEIFHIEDCRCPCLCSFDENSDSHRRGEVKDGLCDSCREGDHEPGILERYQIPKSDLMRVFVEVKTLLNGEITEEKSAKTQGFMG